MEDGGPGATFHPPGRAWLAPKTRFKDYGRAPTFARTCVKSTPPYVR
jgi:hypothetical protein